MKIEEKVLSERMRDFLCEMDLDMADEDMVEIIKSVDNEKKKEYEQSMLGKKLSTNKCVYTDSYFEREKIEEIEKEYKSFTYKKEI